ncbi:MAG: phosphotransferase [Opitutae bacterium]|nr:phosphotransferase [Opitutae bacterium]
MIDSIEFEDNRFHQLLQWLESETKFGGLSVVPASADASFRRYFRVTGRTGSWIVMDAPPDKENSRPFLDIAGYLHAGGVRVPEIFAHDVEQGFIVLEDFGSLHYEDVLSGNLREEFYDLALEEMSLLIRMPSAITQELPLYDRSWLKMELYIFFEWFLHGGENCFDESARIQFNESIQPLLDGILEQPAVFVHRDFHCRNLLVLDEERPGVIDFQGALHGPLTYDLISLLRDCYKDNPTDWVEKKALQQKARYEAALEMSWSDNEFLKWMDWTGLQRHLKVLGLFRRLHMRDGKASYLKDLPRVWGYAHEILCRYNELSALRKFSESFQTWKAVAV